MNWKKIFGFGCLGLLALLVIGGVTIWYNLPSFPITVDEPGEGGERITINERPAHYFHGKGEGPRPVILMLGGSEGGLQEGHNNMARKLQAKGFSVLYPGYYRTSEETAEFDMVPLETFDMSLAWLKARDDIDAANIGVIGGSKGGEAALLIATMHPEISAIVANVPSNAVWQGFSMGFKNPTEFSSSWSLNGKPVPYLPYTLLDFSEMFSDGATGKMYAGSLEKLSEHPEAIIPIEKTEAPILLICGEKDNLWPSCDMSRAVKARATAKGKANVELLTYEDGGHLIYGWPRKETAENFEELAMMGGTAKGNNDARKDNWPKIVAFFEEHLMVTSGVN